MKLIPTRNQVVVLTGMAIVGLVLAFMPHWGAPGFRYTGGEPAHEVWNFGWPLVTCIYDATHAPHFVVGPIAFLYGVVGLVGFVLSCGVLIAWNNRHRLRDSREVETSH